MKPLIASRVINSFPMLLISKETDFRGSDTYRISIYLSIYFI